MFHQIITKSFGSAIRSNIAVNKILPITSIRGMAEGSTGGSRAGGEASGDAFTKREKANEDFYVKQKEKEKLLLLKKKLQEQRAHLDELDKHIEDLTKEQGGEQH
ncbi:MAG: hypothetical protein M1827_001349 [Pycnora praestabilis]|nr:MAG: hypothetical protein M1827_001349 [Pycnora praestabilis]